MDPVELARPLPLLRTIRPKAPVVVGMGGNLGDPAQSFRCALRKLVRDYRLVEVSPLYRSDPVGPPQPDYLNAAVLLDAPGDLHELLAGLQHIENEAGRVREAKWGPRTLDLDILWAGDRRSSTFSLSVPHPELERRAFALRPLLDVFPDACHPGGEPYATMVEPLKQPGFRRVGAKKWWDEPAAS